ncbi:MAG TPA: hypothetical protein VIN58_02900, partial [Roseateles sp.]
ADGTQALTLAGNAQLGGAVGAQQALNSLSVSGGSTLNAGSVTTTGDQGYGGAVTLQGDQVLDAGSGRIVFGSTVDGAQALTLRSGAGGVRFDHAVGGQTRLGAVVINTSGETRLAAPIRAASLTTDAPGTLVLSGTVDTTGAQSYGEHAVLAADVVLAGSSITLAGGVDATTAGGQGATLTGNATLGGAVGAGQALSMLRINGSTALAGNVSTTGDQTYGGAVTQAGNATLHSSGGSLAFGGTLDSTAQQLSLRADAGSIEVAGNVGGINAPGALVLSAGTQASFNGSVRAASVTQTAGGGLTRFSGPLTALGAEGLQLTGHSFAFGDVVTATLGGITLTNTHPSGTVSFAVNGPVQAATGFTQTGGASVLLPATITVKAGPINIGAPASLPAGTASISTDGGITLRGLSGPSTALTLTAGSGAINAGLADADPASKVDLGSLAVVSAASAQMYGELGGSAGAVVASRVNSALVGAPYFFNKTPWGPIEVIARLTATMVPLGVVPSTPGVMPLFTGVVDRNGVVPNVLGAYASPQVLTVAPLAPVTSSPATLQRQHKDCNAAAQDDSAAPRLTTQQCR